MTAVPPNPLAEGLHDYHVGEPCLMVIFGATGDLSGRKLLPALYNLSKQRLLPAGFAVVGAAIDDMTDDSFRKHASEKITQFSRTQPIDQRVLDAFVSSCFYVKVDFGKLDEFKALQRRLAELDTTRHVAGNRMFYCATPPPTYETIVEQLKAAAMTTGDGFHRIVVEKPFGSDLKSARELTDILQRVFHEDEVYRIDHYLGKETVKNIMAFRFANSIFEPVWNANHIDPVDLVFMEDPLEDVGQLARGFQVRAERLLDHDAVKPVAGGHRGRLQLLDDRLVGGWRCRAVEHPVAGHVPGRVELGQAALQRLEFIELAEVDLHVEAGADERVKHALVDRLRARELRDLLGRVLAERVVGHVVDRGADHREARRQQALLGEVVERRKQLAAAEVPGRAEDDHQAWLADVVVVQPFGEGVRGDGGHLRDASP